MNAIVTPNWVVVSVGFDNLVAKTYDYRAERVYEFAPGDTAVVEVNGALKVVDIVDVRQPGDPATKLDERDLKWIVDKVDTSVYLDRMAEVAAVQREMEEIMAEAERRRVHQEVKQALGDPDLVARYDALLARQAKL